jgi:hypothetical protein
MRACIVGAPRIDLSGDPAGVVTEKEAMYAVQRFAVRLYSAMFSDMSLPISVVSILSYRTI